MVKHNIQYWNSAQVTMYHMSLCIRGPGHVCTICHDVPEAQVMYVSYVTMYQGPRSHLYHMSLCIRGPGYVCTICHYVPWARVTMYHMSLCTKGPGHICTICTGPALGGLRAWNWMVLKCVYSFLEKLTGVIGPSTVMAFSVHSQQMNLTHWGWDKMAAILQTTSSNAFSFMKMFEFWLKFHWSLFLRVQLIILQHWF